MGRLDSHDLARIDVDFWRSVGPVIRLRREQLLHVTTLTELCVKHAAFLVNLDDGSAGIVGNNAARRISIHGVLLEQGHVSRVLLGIFQFVTDCDMRVNHGVLCLHMLQTVRVVSLINRLEVELAGFGLRILIRNAIVFAIAMKGSLALDSSIFLARHVKNVSSGVSQGRQLQFLALTYIVSETIGLAVDLSVRGSVVR